MPASHPLKALLLNDASLLGHHGSAIVTAQLVQLAAEAGIDVAPGWTWDAAMPVLAGEEAPYDLLIVNGEGSVHSNSRAAQRISRLAIDLASRRTLPAYLVNATVEGNAPDLDAGLGSFRLRFVRDSVSQAYLARRGVASEVVHDLTLTASDLPRAEGRGPLLVTDASDQDKTRRLIALAQRWDAPAITLRARPPWPAHGAFSRRMGFEMKRQVARLAPLSAWSLRYGRVLSRPAFIDRLAHHARGIVCGRYHAACLALRMGLPFVAIAGNTGKTGALLADAGLESRATNLADLERVDSPFEIAPFGDAERAEIGTFLATVERKARDMFRQIAADARGDG